jgi:hypothetical protein
MEASGLAHGFHFNLNPVFGPHYLTLDYPVPTIFTSANGINDAGLRDFGAAYQRVTANGLILSIQIRARACTHQSRLFRQSLVAAKTALKKVASLHCGLMMSIRNNRANGISERESINQPDCEHAPR